MISDYSDPKPARSELYSDERCDECDERLPYGFPHTCPHRSRSLCEDDECL